MRVATALTGTVLLMCGALALCAGLGAFGAAWQLRPVLDPAVVRYAARNAWFWPVLASAAEFLALVGLAWLIREGRAALRRWRPALRGHVRAQVRWAGEELLRDAERVPGVAEVRMRLTGSAARPRLLMTVTCAEDASPAAIYAALVAGPVARYRAATAMGGLEAVIDFRLRRPGRARRRPTPARTPRRWRPRTPSRTHRTVRARIARTARTVSPARLLRRGRPGASPR